MSLVFALLLIILLLVSFYSRFFSIDVKNNNNNNDNNNKNIIQVDESCVAAHVLARQSRLVEEGKHLSRWRRENLSSIQSLKSVIF
jgi:hypothetical protein